MNYKESTCDSINTGCFIYCEMHAIQQMTFLLLSDWLCHMLCSALSPAQSHIKKTLCISLSLNYIYYDLFSSTDWNCLYRKLLFFFSFSRIWNSVIIINIPLAPHTEEVASVGLVACLANSSCVPHYHTRLWETTFQTLVSTYLPYVYRLDWQPILCSSMDDNYYWWASLWEW